MSAIYYAVNDAKRQAIVVGHSNRFYGLERLKPTTEGEVLAFLQAIEAKWGPAYYPHEVEAIATALFNLGVDEVYSDWGDDHFAIWDYTIVATIYTNKDAVGQPVYKPSR